MTDVEILSAQDRERLRRIAARIDAGVDVAARLPDDGPMDAATRLRALDEARADATFLRKLADILGGIAWRNA